MSPRKVVLSIVVFSILAVTCVDGINWLDGWFQCNCNHPFEIGKIDPEAVRKLVFDVTGVHPHELRELANIVLSLKGLANKTEHMTAYLENSVGPSLGWNIGDWIEPKLYLIGRLMIWTSCQTLAFIVYRSVMVSKWIVFERVILLFDFLFNALTLFVEYVVCSGLCREAMVCIVPVSYVSKAIQSFISFIACLIYVFNAMRFLWNPNVTSSSDVTQKVDTLMKSHDRFQSYMNGFFRAMSTETKKSEPSSDPSSMMVAKLKTMPQGFFSLVPPPNNAPDRAQLQYYESPTKGYSSSQFGGCLDGLSAAEMKAYGFT